jgi:hypothetical protein
MGGLATFPVGGRPDPSANAADANDRNNSATANIRFMLILLKFWYRESAEAPQANSLVPNATAEDSAGGMIENPNHRRKAQQQNGGYSHLLRTPAANFLTEP